MEKAESLQVTRGDFLASLENDIKPVSVHAEWAWPCRAGVAHSDDCYHQRGTVPCHFELQDLLLPMAL
ncbi:Vesicle-fusing ATPase [Cricetulus griseus]|uniref:Vesicle-fusing ATPase n=1 Tax=Cricetulus griseus TaxID=10029 RepID=G3IPX9_CRIGR|nr:Vesicle-fusing ATPase [Cricetulus griseus]